MKILFIATDYPDKKKNNFVFVKQLVDQFAEAGHQCCVIAPFSITHNKRLCKFEEEQQTNSGGVIHVLRPNYISLSNIRIGHFRPSSYFHQRAVNRAVKDLPFRPDVVYAHFWHCGFEIFEFAKSQELPLFIASGESVISAELSAQRYNDFKHYVRGVICVSTKNRDASIQLGLTTEDKCAVIPNSIDPRLFHVMDKKESRTFLGLPQDVFIVIFVGWFNERKGVYRVARAINMAKGGTIHSIFIGGDGNVPCENILFKGFVSHDKLPIYLNAADVFVLPTLNEGCCNAIIEAMACGLPIISSDLPFNWDVLNKENSILIDPNDVEQISESICFLRDHRQERTLLSERALRDAQGLTIGVRLSKILQFIDDKIKKTTLSN